MLFSFAAMLIIAVALSGCGTEEYTLNIIVNGQGLVTPQSGGTYEAGTVVELKVAPADGYVFDH